MDVQRLKYLIWSADMKRAVKFYQDCFGATIERQNPAVTDLSIGGSTIGIHSGGEGKKTWTGLAFQVDDVVAGAEEVQNAGGTLDRPLSTDEGDDAPHLAMCSDTEGNQIMLSVRRS